MKKEEKMQFIEKPFNSKTKIKQKQEADGGERTRNKVARTLEIRMFVCYSTCNCSVW